MNATVQVPLPKAADEGSRTRRWHRQDAVNCAIKREDNSMKKYWIKMIWY